MKKLLLLLFVIPLFSHAQTNMLTNPSFETGSKEGWGGTGPAFQRDDVIDGVYAAKLAKEKGLNQEVSLELGKSYEFSFFAKNAKIDGSCLASIQYNDGSWKHSNSVFITDTIWTEYKLRVKAQERDVTSSRIVFWNLTKVECFIDSVSFIEIDTIGLCHEAKILETPNGTLDSTNFIVKELAIGSVKWANYKENVTLSENATIQIFEKSSQKTYQGAKKLSDAQYLVVVAEDGTIQEYQLEFADYWLKSIKEGTLDNQNMTVAGVDPKKTVLEFMYTLRTYDGVTCTVLDSVNGDPVLHGDSKLMTEDMVIRVDGATLSSYYTVSLLPLSLSSIAEVLSSKVGVLDSAIIKEIPKHTYAYQLTSGIQVLSAATFELLGADQSIVTPDTEVDESMIIEVTAEDGTVKEFTLALGDEENEELRFEYLSDEDRHEHFYQNGPVVLSGKSSLHLYEDEISKVLDNSTVILESEDAWLYLYSIFPQDVNDSLMSHVLVNGKPAKHDDNVRIVQFKDGTVIIPHTPDYRALTVYDEANQGGDSATMTNYLFYRTPELGMLDNAVSSFVLKKGYMATFATEASGRGTSKVYVAPDKDIAINLPDNLSNKVSFVRVIPWRWTHKKGWCGGGKDQPAKLNCAWTYDWNNASTSNLNIEYVPMRHNGGWNKFENMTYKKNSTHALGFNEPDRPDQANMGVDKAISLWPNLLESGLRLGSPAPSDGGLNWLFSFMTKAKNKGLRVDFVAMHYYIGCGSGTDFANRCKYVASKTGKNIWITEWNNGANWTGCKPTYEEQEVKIRNFIDKLDKTNVVERYAIYNWVGNTRAMFKDGGYSPAGLEYKNNSAPMAYNPNNINYMANEVEDPTSSINEVAYEDLPKVWIYPNPTNQPLINVMGIDGEQMVDIFSLQGQKVLSVRTYCDVNISGLKSGLYILRVDGGEGVKLSVK